MSTVINIILWTAYIISLYFSIFILLVFFDKKKKLKEEKSNTSLTRYPIVSILVPAYNEENTILKTLQSINEIKYPKDKLDVIVINDGSKDKTEEIVKQYIQGKSHFQLISHQNRGKGASLNRGLEFAKGEFFACLDADSFVDPLTLRKMLAFYEKENDPELAIITPAMKVDSPKNLLQKVQWLEYLIIIFIARLSSHLDSLYVAPGPFSLYKTKIINKLGGFDPTNITEDQEIAYRVQQHDYRIKQCFDGYVYTTAPAKIKPFYNQRRRWYLGGMLCLYQYKKMVGNKKYGDFGLMQLIKNVAGYILAIAGLSIAAYILAKPLIRYITNIFVINFDLIRALQNLQIRFTTMNLLLTDIKLAIVIVCLFGIGLYFFYQAHKNAGEKVMRFGWIPLIPYFVFYYSLKSTIFLISLVEFSKNKKIKW